MSDIIKIDLGDAGVQFATAALLAGGALSRAVLLAHGPIRSAFAPMPRHAGPVHYADFDSGGATSLGASLQWLASEIARAFPNPSEYWVLIEDPWAIPGDVSGSDQDHRLSLPGADCVVYAMKGEALNADGLARIVRSIRSFRFCGYVIDRRTPQPLHGDILIANLARNARCAFVSAFDRDGLVMAGWATD